MDDRRKEIGFDARPHLLSSPLRLRQGFRLHWISPRQAGAIASKHSEDGPERKLPLTDSGFADDRPANPVVRIFKETANDSPSPWGEGRDEGGRGPFEIPQEMQSLTLCNV